jgi:hypothetical protein
MSSTAAFLASLASILIGAAIGMVLRRTLPADLLEGAPRKPSASAPAFSRPLPHS